MKKLISIILVLIIAAALFTAIDISSVSAAIKPTFIIKNVTSLTYNNAQINATVNNTGKAKITKVGFQIGTVKNKWLTTKSETVPSNLQKSTVLNLKYLMSKWYGKLKPDTTYYYRFNMVADGNTINSAVKSFKTTPDYIYCTNKKATNITYNNATISCYVNNPKKEKITITGFQITADKSFKSNIKLKSYSISNKGSFSRSYNLKNTVGALNENTTYYFRFFNKVGSKNRNSQIVSFKTPKKGSYTKISSLGVSRIRQPADDGNSGSCYLSSIATVYGYKKGSCKTAGKDYTQSCAVYQEVFKANGNTTYVYDETVTKLGLKKSVFSLKTVYNSLKAGKPVAFHGKNGTKMHASVIIGYKGNNAVSLKASDFVVMEIKAGYKDRKGIVHDKDVWDNSTSLFKSYSNNPATVYWSSKSCYVTLSTWQSNTGVTAQNMVAY